MCYIMHVQGGDGNKSRTSGMKEIKFEKKSKKKINNHREVDLKIEMGFQSWQWVESFVFNCGILFYSLEYFSYLYIGLLVQKVLKYSKHQK